MIQKTDKKILGGIFTYLANCATRKKLNLFSIEQIGGKASSCRKMPYIRLGACTSRAWRSVTFDGSHYRVELELTTGTNCMETARSYVANIVEVLSDADFDVDGHVVIEVQHEKSEYISSVDKTGYLVRMLFTILTVYD